MAMAIVKEKISKAKLKEACEETFGEAVKVVVDIERQILALGGELHADQEAALLDDGSQQEDLWGVNFYPWKKPVERIDYIALINIRPASGNRGMKIEDKQIQQKIKEVIEKLLLGEDEQMA